MTQHLPDSRYSELQVSQVLRTIAVLRARVEERFPDSGLGRVAAELERVGRRTEHEVPQLRRPMWVLRIAAFAGVAAIVAVVVVGAVMGTRVSGGSESLSELLQGVEAALNEVVFLGLAVFFLMSLETRFKRRRALEALHGLRSIVHIVDMHQLTKDPEQVLSPERPTRSSPARRQLSRFELARYLDYCSEMLSLSSKLAALHVQYVNDPVVLNAVNDIETLASSLSGKVWQKIMILDTTLASDLPAAERTLRASGDAGPAAASNDGAGSIVIRGEGAGG